MNVTNPDIIVSFGYKCDFINYDSVVKIMTLNNEPCLYPDDIYFDYYLGTPNKSLEDTSRSCYFPWWIENWFRAKREGIDFNQYRNRNLLNRGFCSHIGRLDDRPHRMGFMKALSVYKEIDHVGSSSYDNLVLPGDSRDTLLTAKLNFISQYKFNITCENVDKVGYITEKAIDPFFAFTVPIYFGNNQTFYNDFEYDDRLMLNGKTYQEVIDYVKFLDTHDDAYLALIDRYFHPEQIEAKVKEYCSRVSRFFSRIIDEM